MYKIEVIKSKKQWYWRVAARNGKILCHSEKYKNKKDACDIAHKVFDNTDNSIIIVKG